MTQDTVALDDAQLALAEQMDGAPPDDLEDSDEAPQDDREWYVIHTYSGYENKVRTNLEHRVESMGVQDKIFQIVIPTEEEVESAKSQYRGTVLIEHESASSRMVHLAHEEIYRRSYTPPEELVSRVLAVTREQVAEMARQYLPPERFALVALGPKVEGGIREADWQ